MTKHMDMGWLDAALRVTEPANERAALSRILHGMYTARGYLRVTGEPKMVLDLVNGAKRKLANNRAGFPT